MSLGKRIRSGIRNLIRKKQLESQLDEEIRTYVDMLTEEKVAAGASSAEARRISLVNVGGVEQVKQAVREQRTGIRLEIFWQSFCYALRQLRKNPGFAITAILTLAIGIGATTAIFSLVYAVLLRPLPFPQSDRLVWLSQQDHSLPGVVMEPLSYPDYFDWRAQSHSFSGLASYDGGGVTVQRDGESQRLDAGMVSSNFFRVLGVAPILGRDFRWEEEKAGNRAVILSYAIWQNEFGAAKNIVGQSITLNDQSYIVAGVMPESFRYPFGRKGAELWLSLAGEGSGADSSISQRGNDHLDVIGRLKPDVTLDQAKAELDVIATGIARRYPDTNKWYTSVLAHTLLDHTVGDTRPALRVLFGSVALMLLLACANIAGLLMARGSQRSAEFALRSAVGAGRSALIRLLLVESVTLSLCGGVAGIIVAPVLLKVLIYLVPVTIPRIYQVSVNGMVLAFALIVSIVTGLLFGLLPAWQGSKVAPSQALREGSRTLRLGRWQQKLQSGLVIAQTMIGLVLLVGSGLLIRSFIQVLHVDPGFDTRNVYTARLRVPFDRYSHDQHFQFYEQLLAKIRVLPGVQSASADWPLPLSNSRASVSFAIAGRPLAPGDRPSETVSVVMPDAFETLRIPLLSGRTFTERDGLQGSPVAIVNQAFARKYFPGNNPIGQHIVPGLGDDSRFDHSSREIVGVVGDVKRSGLTAEVDPEYYLPYAQAVITDPYLTVRTNGDPSTIDGEIRAAVREIDKGVPVYQVQMLEDYVSQSEAQPRFEAVIISSFAGVALLLSAIGLYGLLSYSVTQRASEIGLRMAIGAQRMNVLSMILVRGLKLAGIGFVGGIVASVFLTSLLTHMLYHVQPLDPFTFSVVGAVLLSVSVLASFAPAWRASRLDPTRTLRDQ